VRYLLLGLVLLGAAMVGLAQITGRNGARGHPLGSEVVVGHAQGRIGLTVLDVRRGTPEQLEANGFRLNDEEREATPYYVDARIVNRGPNSIDGNLHLGVEDSRGRLIRNPILLRFSEEPFELCPERKMGTVKPGASFEACTFVLVPEGRELGKVYFLSEKGPAEEPELVYWATK
jgi:hypothetical protein